jgi:hypothetical protein
MITVMEHHDSHHMQQLLQYISHNRANGVPDPQIHDALIQSGWPAHLVDQGMHGHAPAPHTPLAPQAVQHQPESSHPQHQPQVAHQPEKYKVFKALSDSWAAVRANAKTFALTMLVTYGLLIVSLLVVAAIIIGLARGMAPDDSYLGFVIFGIIGIFVTVWAWYVLAGSFMFSVVAFAVNDGANRQKSTVGSVLSRAAAVFWRVAKANVWSGLVTLGPPLAVLLLVVFAFLGTGSDSSSALAILTPFVIFGALVWVLLCTVRFALVSYVAVFEPQVAARRTLARSRMLLREGGIWFVWKLIFLAGGIQIVVSLLTGTSLSDIGEDGQHPLVSIVQLLMTLVVVTVLLMLYRNRYARHHG